MNDASIANGRPECMTVLGLLPPYLLDDVHKAYKARALEVHPDRGGSQADFLALQEAYEQAQAYVTFLAGRQQWLAAQVEPYLKQQEVAAEVGRRGGRVTIEDVEWMSRSFGDFAVLAERLKAIELHDCADGDAFLSYLEKNGKLLRFLHDLDLTGSTVSDAGLACLLELRELRRLNLSGTQVTESGLALLQRLPELRRISVAGTALGWFARRRLKKLLPGVAVISRDE